MERALRCIAHPHGAGDIVETGLIGGLTATSEGVVRFTLEANGLSAEETRDILAAAERTAAAEPGVARVAAVATGRAPATPPPGFKTRAGGHANPLGLGGGAGQAAVPLPGVETVLAVASGKGGVGKSTVATHLALAFARMGLSVGLMDADIYGPSIPTIFGLTEKPAMRAGKIVPAEAYGLKLMSIGLLVNPDKALAWRGPMVMGAVRQLMNDVDWGALDMLIIDTPPGTGDAHLTLAQTRRLAGAVIVSTPQELALADVRRGIELFRTVRTPVLGVIENMAWLDDAEGRRSHPFGSGGAERAASAMGAPFLGALPLIAGLREACDAGEPVTEPGHEATRRFDELARRIKAELDALGAENTSAR